MIDTQKTKEQTRVIVSSRSGKQTVKGTGRERNSSSTVQTQPRALFRGWKRRLLERLAILHKSGQRQDRKLKGSQRARCSLFVP